MSPPNRDQKKLRQELEEKIRWQIAFASGIFQDDITIRTLLESLGEGVVIIDTTGTILLVNAVAEKMFGYERKELIGKPHSMLIPERFRKGHDEHEADYFKEPRIRPMGLLLDLCGLRRDGSEFPLEISLSYIETVSGLLVMAFVSDVTLRKEYEERLRETEQRFASFMLHLPAAAWMKDMQGRYVYANAEAERIFSAPLPELQGKTDDELFPPETARQFKENDCRLFSEGGSIQTTEVLRQADGVEHCSLVSKFAVPDPDGRPAYIGGVAFDITDLKSAEEALRLSEARYRALYRDNPTMISTIDADFTMLSVNPFCANQLGYTMDELEGRSVLTIFHEDDRSAVAEQLRDCLDNPDRVNRWQFRKVRKDGSPLWVEEIAHAVRDLSGALNVLVVCQDITDRKRAEDALKESEEKLRFASAAAGIGMWHWDLVKNELTWDDRCKEMFGYPPDYPMTYDAFLKPILEEDRQRIGEAVHKALQEKSEYSVEMRVALPDGQIRWVLSKGRGFYDEQGEQIRMHGIAMDVTDRKRAEAEIQKLASFPLLNPNPVLELDANGQMIFCNPAAQQVLENAGYTDSNNPLIPHDMPVILEYLQDRKVSQFRREIGLNDRFFEELIYIEPQFQSVRIYTMDITERTRVGEALRLEKAFTDTVINSMPGIFYVFDDREHLIRWNKRLEEFSGRSPDGMPTLRPHDFVAEEDHRLLGPKLREVFVEHRDADVELLLLDREGRRIPFYCTGSPMTVGDSTYLVGLGIDISERKRAEEAAVQAKEAWERTFDSVPDLIAILDDQYRIVRVNRAMAERLGRRPEECQGFNCHTLLHGSESPPEYCPHFKTMKEGRENTSEIHEGHLGGHFLVSTTPLRNREVTGVVCVARDITERKRSEEEIERLNTDLAARATELESANRELEAFNYTVAHDLRKPLAATNGYCQAIRELCGDKLDEHCTGYLREAYEGTLRMNRLIDALLNFSRMARIELRRETIDLTRLTQELAEELRMADPERRVTFRIGDGIKADGDLNLLRIALDNLLGNAWKYTAGREEAIIAFGVAEVEGTPAFFVRDNGTGFAMADAAMLFIPFQRLPGAEEFRGHGIGLATVERIIRRHGGRIWAEGEPGKGATFWFTLS